MKRISILVGVAICVFLIYGLMTSYSRSSVILDHSFKDVVQYISMAFGTNVADITIHDEELWGPVFLKTNQLYWVKTHEYTPNRSLTLTAYYYQIGGENIRFMLDAIDANTSRLSVENKHELIITFPRIYLGIFSGEKRILDKFVGGINKAKVVKH